MELKHANGEQMTVEKLISFVLAEKRSFFKDWKSNPMEFNRNSPNLQSEREGGVKNCSILGVRLKTPLF